ncbi:hypothetical protein [Microvirga lotononidis]|uniref:Uncharacterized protein n=1 Tax=Microvirga lotononidis TaxID=864069 RepID=I4YP31_9HYPH|nr:hypothetical protein [Microvirga lotononidis]EIM25723.1 hypothetical protein MicloDRAFT_00064500 [Microvirga lotononidis]WQO25657.1 hypothetical protein U0023_13115 [Microvirga lotononidis]
MTHFQQRVFKLARQKLPRPVIAERLGTSSNVVKVTISVLRRRGYDIPRIKSGPAAWGWAI